MTDLPGLDFDPMRYEIIEMNGMTVAKILFSDWLPPDHEDVLCSLGGGWSSMYFSPASGMMVPSDSERAGFAIKPSDLTFWLKVLK